MYSSTKQEAVSLVLCNFENSGLPRGIISLISKSKYIPNTPEINTKVFASRAVIKQKSMILIKII